MAFYSNMKIFACIAHKYLGGGRSLKANVVGNGIGDPCSNHGRGFLRSLCADALGEKHESIPFTPAMGK